MLRFFVRLSVATHGFGLFCLIVSDIEKMSNPFDSQEFAMSNSTFTFNVGNFQHELNNLTQQEAQQTAVAHQAMLDGFVDPPPSLSEESDDDDLRHAQQLMQHIDLDYSSEEEFGPIFFGPATRQQVEEEDYLEDLSHDIPVRLSSDCHESCHDDFYLEVDIEECYRMSKYGYPITTRVPPEFTSFQDWEDYIESTFEVQLKPVFTPPLSLYENGLIFNESDFQSEEAYLDFLHMTANSRIINNLQKYPLNEKLAIPSWDRDTFEAAALHRLQMNAERNRLEEESDEIETLNSAKSAPPVVLIGDDEVKMSLNEDREEDAMSSHQL